MEDHAARGADARAGWFEEYGRVLRRLADWLGAPADWVIFTPNVSWTIGAVAHGLDWKPGDEVLIPANEFPANVYPWMTAAQRFGIELRKVEPDASGRVSAEMLLEAVGARTRLISASQVSFVTGYRLDVAKLAAGARERGVLTVIDAAQSVGWARIDFEKLGCDMLVGVNRKFLCALDGMGFVAIRPEFLERLTLVAPGPFSVVHDSDYLLHEPIWKPNAHRLSNGAISTPDAYALGSSLELFGALGPAGIEGRCMKLAGLLRQECAKAGIGVMGDDGWSRAESSATSFIRRVDEQQAAALAEAGIAVSLRHGGARVSTHAFNTEEEVLRLVTCLGG